MKHLAKNRRCFRRAKQHDKMCDFSGYTCVFCNTRGHLEDACQVDEFDLHDRLGVIDDSMAKHIANGQNGQLPEA